MESSFAFQVAAFQKNGKQKDGKHEDGKQACFPLLSEKKYGKQKDTPG